MLNVNLFKYRLYPQKVYLRFHLPNSYLNNSSHLNEFQLIVITWMHKIPAIGSKRLLFMQI